MWAHSPREPPHVHSAGVATGTVARRLHIMSTTTTTTTTRDRVDHYGPMEWAQKYNNAKLNPKKL